MKFVKVVLIWLAVIGCYIILAATHPAQQQLVSEASADLSASANMSNFPGTKELVDAWPLLVWFIPGIGGGIFTIIVLREEQQPAGY